MLRHVVIWTLKAEEAEERAAALAAIKAALEPLAESVPSVRSLVVAGNIAYETVNQDVILVSDFDDVAGLDAYQTHPEHVAAAAIVREHVSARAAVDYEV